MYYVTYLKYNSYTAMPIRHANSTNSPTTQRENEAKVQSTNAHDLHQVSLIKLLIY